MKKIMLFLAICLGYFLLETLPVEAMSAQFYEAEYIPNVYVVRQKGNQKYYQQGRVFRNVKTNEVAYCLQPFALFDKNAIYDSQDTFASIDSEKQKQIKDVVSLGYPYIYSSLEYYFATQMRIWQIMEPDCQFYYTDGLNGPKTTAQNHWFSKLDDILNAYSKTPEFHGKTYEVTPLESVSVTYPFANFFETTIESELPYTKQGNTVTFSTAKSGTYQVKFKRNYNRISQEPILFYFHGQSQLLVNRGNPMNEEYRFQIKVVDTSITVKKIDKDNKSNIPRGEANLMGAKFSLYNEKKEKLATITLDHTLEATISTKKGNIEALPFGTYYLKEELAGEGYLCSQEEIKVTLDSAHADTIVFLENQVIQNQVSIQKLFGNQQLFQSESGVIFEIFDSKGWLVQTIQTGEDGMANVLLPYGTYTIHQKTSKEGYQKVDDFKIVIKEEGKEHHFVLYDAETPRMEVDVPDTKISTVNVANVANAANAANATDAIHFFPLVGALLGGIYVQKKNTV